MTDAATKPEPRYWFQNTGGTHFLKGAGALPGPAIERGAIVGTDELLDIAFPGKFVRVAKPVQGVSVPVLPAAVIPVPDHPEIVPDANAAAVTPIVAPDASPAGPTGLGQDVTELFQTAAEGDLLVFKAGRMYSVAEKGAPGTPVNPTPLTNKGQVTAFVDQWVATH